jgi:hypothetical protein
MPKKIRNLNQGSTSIPMTIVLALCSGMIGALLSPFFQAHLANEQMRAEQINDVIENLQGKHMEMTLNGWRLTIASKATKEELNRIHDAWLFAHRGVTKWLDFAIEYLDSREKQRILKEYQDSMRRFYDLETTEFGLADDINRPKGQKLIAELDANFANLRGVLIRSARISIF